MQNILFVLIGVLHQDINAGLHPVLTVFLTNATIIKDLFNGQFLFVMKFLVEVVLVFIVCGAIGKLFHLDRCERSGDHERSWYEQEKN